MCPYAQLRQYDLFLTQDTRTGWGATAKIENAVVLKFGRESRDFGCIWVCFSSRPCDFA